MRTRIKILARSETGDSVLKSSDLKTFSNFHHPPSFDESLYEGRSLIDEIA